MDNNNIPYDGYRRHRRRGHHHKPFKHIPPHMNGAAARAYYHRYVASVFRTAFICAAVCICVKIISDNKHNDAN